jgi:hypothetical protein
LLRDAISGDVLYGVLHLGDSDLDGAGRRHQPVREMTETDEKSEASGEALVDDAAPPRLRRLLLPAVNILVLCSLLGLYMAYVVKSQQQPVYGWIAGTPVESLATDLCHLVWQQRYSLSRHASDSPLLPEERTSARELMMHMEDLIPAHALLLSSGERVFCDILRRTDSETIVRVHDGTAAETRSIANGEIRLQKSMLLPPVEFSPRDIRFFLAWPESNAFGLAPYAIVSDSGFADVHELYLALTVLSDEFRLTFSPLIAVEPVDFMHVNMITNKAAFVRQSQAESVELVNSTGFYRSADKCLFVLNDLERRSAAPGGTEQGHIIRHEGIHQLADVYRILPAGAGVPLWIHEGMAMYGATLPFGGDEPAAVMALRAGRREGRLLNWPVVIGLNSLAEVEEAELDAEIVYAQSWLLFSFLMRKPTRGKLFRYLRLLHENAGIGGGDRSGLQILLNNLELTESKLVEQLNNEIEERFGAANPAD